METRFAVTVLCMVPVLIGCMAAPVHVEPLSISASAATNAQSDLCELYANYGLAERSTCRPVMPTEETKEEFRFRRNSLQHALLSESTARCEKFKSKFSGRPTFGVIRLESLSALLSAGAAVVSGPGLARSLAAAAGTTTTVSGVVEEQYLNDSDSVFSGIELERRRIFLQIRDSRDKDVFEYPVTQAVNDALRYHGVCNLVEGRSTSASAVESAVSELPDDDLDESPEEDLDQPEDPSDNDDSVSESDND